MPSRVFVPLRGLHAPPLRDRYASLAARLRRCQPADPAEADAHDLQHGFDLHRC
eukprot:CAMPEP_0119496424 /NCGR_PEP_ID=MMETSP1344-20130328/19767_1 /TAXON_ID=236787 /ORGANISM="Florenciella parvula, Strain CCMP2471" /LENGTH=53 /DNA_ID=CAMNT_0007532115 /DNA_START=163 /DNA_END=324 /DNA_ORIENTATION=+